MKNKWASLIPAVLSILRDKGTEKPFSTDCETLQSTGTYLCRGCGSALFRGAHQFQSTCGWPSFDNDIPNAITHKADQDGVRTEILCAHCQGHLGHVFYGEGLTNKNMRHCVNGMAIEWVADEAVLKTEEAILAAGCFWGVEYLFRKKKGVVKTEVGYTGGALESPNYHLVCAGHSGHREAVRVLFDPSIISYESVIKFYFEIHDPEDMGGQGPDRGEQYKGAIYYFDATQEKIAQRLKNELLQMGYRVVTDILPAAVFWPAEEKHQHYYEKTGHTPYCHVYQKKWA